MRKVYRVSLKAGYNSTLIPSGFEVLDVFVAYDEPYLLVVGEDHMEPFTPIEVVLTTSGSELHEDDCTYKYIATVSISGGATVFHAFLLERK